MICVDCSEFMRNSDYRPTRFQAQADAINILAGAKTQANPESCVGVLSLAGKTPRVLVTPTPDLGAVLNSLHDLQIDGSIDLHTGVQVAQLALKHRQNKNQHQRVILFVGSPIDVPVQDLIKLGKKLKKNSVAVDVVSFGEANETAEKLECFVSAANNNDNSHFVHIDPGQEALSDALLATPLFTTDDSLPGGFAAAAAASAAAAQADGPGFHLDGVDPNIDPELAMALRVSMEEERARQEAAAQDFATGIADATVKPNMSGNNSAEQSIPRATEVPVTTSEDESLLQQALALSMAGTEIRIESKTSHGDSNNFTREAPHKESTEKLQSSQPSGVQLASDTAAVLQDTNFVTDVLQSLPGVSEDDASPLMHAGNTHDKDAESENE